MIPAFPYGQKCSVVISSPYLNKISDQVEHRKIVTMSAVDSVKDVSDMLLQKFNYVSQSEFFSDFFYILNFTNPY